MRNEVMEEAATSAAVTKMPTLGDYCVLHEDRREAVKVMQTVMLMLADHTMKHEHRDILLCIEMLGRGLREVKANLAYDAGLI
jgi:hypothetical protein